MLMPSIFGENLFNDDWMNFGFPEVDKALYGKHAGHEMKTDVRETEAGYEVDIDLPGFKKDEINVELNNGYLSISAAKGLDKDEKKEGRYLRREFSYTKFQQTMILPDDVDKEKIGAHVENGVLNITLPKFTEAEKEKAKKFIDVK